MCLNDSKYHNFYIYTSKCVVTIVTIQLYFFDSSFVYLSSHHDRLYLTIMSIFGITMVLMYVGITLVDIGRTYITSVVLHFEKFFFNCGISHILLPVIDPCL